MLTGTFCTVNFLQFLFLYSTGYDLSVCAFEIEKIKDVLIGGERLPNSWIRFLYHLDESGLV